MVTTRSGAETSIMSQENEEQHFMSDEEEDLELGSQGAPEASKSLKDLQLVKAVTKLIAKDGQFDGEVDKTDAFIDHVDAVFNDIVPDTPARLQSRCVQMALGSTITKRWNVSVKQNPELKVSWASMKPWFDQFRDPENPRLAAVIKLKKLRLHKDYLANGVAEFEKILADLPTPLDKSLRNLFFVAALDYDVSSLFQSMYAQEFESMELPKLVKHVMPLGGNSRQQKQQRKPANGRPAGKEDASYGSRGGNKGHRDVHFESMLRKLEPVNLKDGPYKPESLVNKKVRVLVDCGSSLDAVSESFVTKNKLKTVAAASLNVKVVDGRRVACERVLKNAKLKLGCVTEVLNLRVIPMPQYDVILGLPWLQRNAVIPDWDTGDLTVLQNGRVKKVKSVTSAAKERRAVRRPDWLLSKKSFKKLLRQDDSVWDTCYMVAGEHVEELFMVELESEKRAPAGASIAAAVSAAVLGAGTSSERVPQLLKDYDTVFPPNPPGLPPDRAIVHEIKLQKGATPVHRAPYRLSVAEEDELKKRLKELSDLGLIRPSKSPWAAPVLFVPKKDGTLRFCVDYRGLNKVTIRDEHALPIPEDQIRRLHGAKVFSKIDLHSGYYQIAVAGEDVTKTAFTTTFGLYEFLVMPFGLSNAPATFSRLMMEIFKDYLYDFVLVYLDDILIFSKDEEEHEKHVRLVLDRLKEHNLIAKLSKCSFFQAEVEYLGFVVSGNGVKMAEDKVRAVLEWPTPSNATEVRGFLGLTGFYRHFIKHYAHIAAPLNELTKKSLRFLWTPLHTHAFEELKKSVTSSPVLQVYDASKQCVVCTDASNVAVGAVLLQVGESTEALRPVAFFSRKLRGAELNYDARTKEFLAIKLTAYKWKHYLNNGTTPLFYTDHQSLQYLNSQTELSPKFMRWFGSITGWLGGPPDIRYKPGKQNVVADALSRRPDHCICALSLVVPADDLIQQIRDGLKLDEFALQEAEKIKAGTSDYFWENELLYRFINGRLQLYVPKVGNLREMLISEMHDLPLVGHQGTNRTLRRLIEQFGWPGIAKDVEEYVGGCQSCLQSKPRTGFPAGLLQPLERPGEPWESISMDFIVKLPKTKEGYDAVMVVVDRFSKYVEFVPTFTTASAEDIATLFYKNILCPLADINPGGAAPAGQTAAGQTAGRGGQRGQRGSRGGRGGGSTPRNPISPTPRLPSPSPESNHSGQPPRDEEMSKVDFLKLAKDFPTFSGDNGVQPEDYLVHLLPLRTLGFNSFKKSEDWQFLTYSDDPFATFCEFFIKRFSFGERNQLARDKLRSLEWRGNVVKLASLIQQHAAHTDITDSEQCDCFIRLLPTEMAEHVLLMRTVLGHHSFSEAITMAVNYASASSSRKMKYNGQNSGQRKKFQSGHVSGSASGQGKHSSGQRQGKSPYNNNNGVQKSSKTGVKPSVPGRKCWGCGSPDHLKKDCPKATTGVNMMDVDVKAQIIDLGVVSTDMITSADGVPTCANQLLIMEGSVSTLPVKVMIDGGAGATFITGKCAKRLNLHPRTRAGSITVRLANGSTYQCRETVTVPLRISTYRQSVRMFVLDVDSAVGIILGKNWLEFHNPHIDWRLNTVEFVYQDQQILLSTSGADAAPAAPTSGSSLISATQLARILRNKNTPVFLINLNLVEPSPPPSAVNSRPAAATNDDDEEEFDEDGDLIPRLTTDEDPWANIHETYEKEYFDVFDLRTFFPPERNVQHEIPLEPGHMPPCQRPYRISPREMEELQKQIREMIDAGIIQPSSSPYAAPVIFVPKQDGTLRMCVDYRALNKITIKDKFPLPKMDELLNCLEGARYFSKIDLKSAYYQVRVKEEDIPKTAFNTRYGHYEFRVMPFGLTNAPATFQKLMNSIFADSMEKFLVVYLDDILIFSKTAEEHDKHIRYVLDRLREHQLHAGLQKCRFFQTEIEFVGYLLTAEGIHMLPKKVDAILNWPVPTTASQVKSFLGLATFYRHFVEHFAHKAIPLYQITRKKSDIHVAASSSRSF
ncbi:hypothetical protein KSW81_007707 [Nannochloris sp. 'desiccata']|nr:hypothetical protein KSW81_007707 [Chlorella desiccata (nom. nud.)]